MFRPIRRIKQTLNEDESIKILNDGLCGILAVNGDDGYPYTIPLNYVFLNNCIYFHSAKQGHKIDSIANNNKVSFCVVDKNEIVENKFTSFFRSVVVFGKANIIDDEEEKIKAIKSLADKYSPNESIESKDEEINKSFLNMAIIRLDIEHISGKQSKELVKKNIGE